jgi:hypothetical protein
MKLSLLSLLVGFTLAPHAARSATFTFDTLPANGVLSGAAGETLGFGYTLTNPSTTDWLVISSLDAGVFLDGVADASLFDFPVLAPGESRTTSFAAGSSGLFAFTWDGLAPVGSLNAGTFVLGGEWWTTDPAGGGTWLADATSVSAPYQVQLVVEPGFWWLLSGAAAAVRADFGRRRRTPRSATIGRS